MIRNCVYNNREKSIYLWTWDSEGNRIKEVHDYKPYLMLEDKKGEYESIYGTKLKKKEFRSSYERNKFVKESGVRRIFENIPPYQQFLIDNFWHVCEDKNFSKYPLKTYFLDIECPRKDSFPDPETAEAVINLLTCYDSLSKKYYVFGLKKYESERDDVVYKHCKSEEDLLKSFIKWFSKDYPDVLSSWNGASFDIPYLINRITFELGEEYAKDLSPIGRIYEKNNFTGKYGLPYTEYVIDGISCLDYIILYKKFMDTQESYKLDHIGEKELGIKKIEHEGNLWDLSRNDWRKYTDYNIRDVELLVKLDQKLDFISLIRFIANNGLCGLQHAINTVPVITGAVAIKARSRDQYISSFIRADTGRKNPGGFVQDSLKGMHRNVVSFDANSLYPSVMISLNISPETKVGKVEKNGDLVNVKHSSGKFYELTKENFAKFLENEKLAVSQSGHLFHQKWVGLMPEFLDNLYSKRKAMKNRGFELEKSLDQEKLSEKEKQEIEYEIQKCDTFQKAYKICLNSMYGYTGNRYAHMGDDDIATSVTLTGQVVNQKNRDLFVDYIKEKFGASDKDAREALIAGDTDSGYFSIDFLRNSDINLKNYEGEISKDFFNVCDDVENYINEQISEWVKRKFRSLDSRIVYKREVIAESSIFLKKKHYVMRILNDEGKSVDKIKYKGVDVVRREMPSSIKSLVKDVVEHMLIEFDYKENIEKNKKLYNKFKTLSINEIAQNSGIKEYDKYANKCDGLNTVKGMPRHNKSAYFYNLVLDKEGLNSKYEKIKSGDVLRMVYIKTPNKYNIDTIGFMETWPEEFSDIFQVDYEKMFDKIVYSSISRFYEAVGWKLRKPSENLKVELDDIFA